MTSHKLARDYLGKVKSRLKALRLFLADERYDDVVREAQEAVELLLKGACRYVGIDPPRLHDPAGALLQHVDRLPEEWQTAVARVREISRWLVEERSAAFYGDEDDMVPPSELFERADAERAIADVEFMLGLYERMLDG